MDRDGGRGNGNREGEEKGYKGKVKGEGKGKRGLLENGSYGKVIGRGEDKKQEGDAKGGGSG